jgi:hypothetical protein
MVTKTSYHTQYYVSDLPSVCAPDVDEATTMQALRGIAILGVEEGCFFRLDACLA